MQRIAKKKKNKTQKRTHQCRINCLWKTENWPEICIVWPFDVIVVVVGVVVLVVVGCCVVIVGNCFPIGKSAVINYGKVCLGILRSMDVVTDYSWAVFFTARVLPIFRSYLPACMPIRKMRLPRWRPEMLNFETTEKKREENGNSNAFEENDVAASGRGGVGIGDGSNVDSGGV